jgi:hypothetical protein
VCFVDNRSLKKIRRGEMLENHSPCWHAQWSTQLENAVGRCVRGALWEPDSIASLETVRSDGFKWGKGVDRIQYGWSCRVLQCCQWRTFTQVEGGNARRRATWGHLLMEDGCCTHLEHLPNVFAVVVAFVVAAVPGFCIAAAVVVVNPC